MLRDPQGRVRRRARWRSAASASPKGVGAAVGAADGSGRRSPFDGRVRARLDRRPRRRSRRCGRRLQRCRRRAFAAAPPNRWAVSTTPSRRRAIGELVRGSGRSGAMAQAVSDDPNAGRVAAEVEAARLALYALVRLKAGTRWPPRVLEPTGRAAGPLVAGRLRAAAHRGQARRAGVARRCCAGPASTRVAFAARGLGVLEGAPRRRAAARRCIDARPARTFASSRRRFARSDRSATRARSGPLGDSGPPTRHRRQPPARGRRRRSAACRSDAAHRAAARSG